MTGYANGATALATETRTEDSFESRVAKRTTGIGIIGLGYVGLPLLLAFAEEGYPVIGFDIDRTKIEKLRNGETYLKHIPSEAIRRGAVDRGTFFTDDFALNTRADVLVICVPTPLTEQREPDLSFVVRTAEDMAPHLRKGQLVIFESTTYPGTTDEVIRPILEKSGLTCGRDFFLAYSPEREDPGNIDFTTRTIPKVIGGFNERSLEMTLSVYGSVFKKVVPVSSTRVAEAVKLTENIFRCVNIALMNELKLVYGKMDIDIWEVIEAAKTKPFGFMPFYPGPGLGGHCIPIDPFYLTWKAREYGISTKFIEIAGEINTAMPEHVIQKLMDALNDREKTLRNARVLVVGLAYKRDIDDIRESPSLELLKILREKGAQVDFHDPYIPEVPRTRKYSDLAGVRNVPLDSATVAGYDAVLIATDHSRIDYRMIAEFAPLVVDTRNAMAGMSNGRMNIVKA